MRLWARRRLRPRRLRSGSALLVAGEGAHHAVLAAEVVAAPQRQVLRPAKMGVDCPAEGAAWMLDVDRHGRAAAPDGADDLAAVAGAFPNRRGAGSGHLAE